MSEHAGRRRAGRLADGATFDDLDPFTGEVVARVPAGSREDARRAIEAAAAAFPAGRGTAGRAAADLPAAADILERRRDEVVSWLARETGCKFGFGMFQMGFVPGLFRQAAALAYAPLGEILPPTSRAPSRWACGGRSASSARSRRGTPR